MLYPAIWSDFEPMPVISAIKSCYDKGTKTATYIVYTFILILADLNSIF